MQKTMYSQVSHKAPLAAARCFADQVSLVMILMMERAAPETMREVVQAAARAVEEDVQVKRNFEKRQKPC